MQRPSWLPKYFPELDGVRGLAILGVVLYHCHPLLQKLPNWPVKIYGEWFNFGVYQGSLWGWSGVVLFFFLSGFLITSNLLATRDEPKYFHNFHARRALRIWPLYLLLLGFVYWNAPWYVGGSTWEAVKHAPWLAYLFCVQNLFALTLPPAIGPTWALAIEEQYYFVWAPAVRWLRRPWMLAAALGAALAAAPWLRASHPHWITPTHTLIHLDGLALGSLLAIGFHTLKISQRAWKRIGLAAFALGFAAAMTVAGGTALLDSALALGFGGAVLALIASSGARCPVHAALRRGPLAFYGRISYGVYMAHIAVFVYFGWFDLKMAPYGNAGSVAIVCFRLAASTAVAAALWYGFESQVLKLKKYF